MMAACLCCTGLHGQAAAAKADGAITITLQEAIRRAEAVEPLYASAVADSQNAQLARSIARAALLPSARAYSQDIYTQPNGIYAEGGEGVLSSDPKFVANDSRPREYIEQGIVEEKLDLAGPAAVRRADASALQAAAELEIARRGLVATVTRLYFDAIAADARALIAERAHDEAVGFVSLTEKREQAREAAHADVVKAQLEEQTRARELEDARLGDEKARLELGVLLFADPNTPYTLADEKPTPLASREEVEQAAAKSNPELKSALAALAVSNADVMAARAAYVPSAVLDFNYGIDANEFAVNGPLTPSGAQARNLGYSTTFTVNLPVWDWLATEHKVKQSEIRRRAAQVALTATQRELIARLNEAYDEAATAQNQLTSLDASVATAAESLRLTKLSYAGGEASVLEVVDAQAAYVTAEVAREDGRVRYRTALADLQTLTGNL